MMQKLLSNYLFLFFWPLLLLVAYESPAPQENNAQFPRLAGPYLGQTPPGKIPEVFAPDIISAEKIECYCVVTPEGNEIFFVEVVTKNNQGFATILYTRRVNGFWTKPEIAPFSGTYCDAYIAIHPNGSRLYFQSNRPIDPRESTFEWNIWYVDKTDDRWGEPKSIGKPINGRANTSGPSVTMTGTMYFTEIANDGANEIFRSELLDGLYQEPERLSAKVNSGKQQFDSYVAPDERFLIFGAYRRPDSHGETDLYISFRDETGSWSESINMGSSINSSGNEGTATITFDKKYVFYSKYNNEAKGMDIYWFSAQFVDELRPQKPPALGASGPFLPSAKGGL